MVPKIIRDRNGKLTTVHVKPIDDTAPQRSIPAPFVKQQISKVELDQFLDAMKNTGNARSNSFNATLVSKYDASIIPFFNRLFQQSNKQESDHLCESIDGLFNYMTKLRDKSSNSNDWEKKCKELILTDLTNSVLTMWNSRVIVEKLGNGTEFANVAQAMYSYHSRHGVTADPTHYQGIALLAASRVPFYRIADDYQTTVEFASWVAEQDNIDRVISLVKERKTVDLQVLKALIEQSEGKPQVLTDGLL